MRESDKYKFDSDCQKPKHDEIVLWLYSKLDDPEFLKSVVDRSWGENLNPTVLKKTIEYPISAPSPSYGNSHGTKVVGFCDLVLVFERDVTMTNFDTGKVSISRRESYIFFEIKTAINIGETLRQIRYYDQSSYQCWFVVAPGNTHEKLFKEQKIGYIEYKP